MGWRRKRLEGEAEFHVSPSGNDSNAGTAGSPWLTIQHAVETAPAGSTILLHAGTYREQVDPPTGGISEAQRTVIRAAPGETVYWKGSERVTTWSSIGGGVWEVTIANASFNGFNPYGLFISGSYLTEGTATYHRGGVFLDGTAYTEVTSSGAVNSEGKWWCSVGGSDTTIRAHFGSNNPNSQLAEVTYRKAWIYATAMDGSDLSGVDFIELRGIHFEHAATNWANPEGAESPQEGGIMPNGGYGWLIERCWIRHSRCVGISVGTYTGEQDDTDAGHHTIRYCTVEYCGQGGIEGSHGAFGSVIDRCLIQNIGNGNLWGGFEQAGIKLHSAVDVTIRNNVFRHFASATRGLFGIWIDWQGQNSRITGNVFYDIADQHLWFEANHGPLIVDNNVFHESGSSEVGGLTSEFSVYAHNLFVGCAPTAGAGDARTPHWFTAHTFNSAGSSALDARDNHHYNNLFSEAGSNAIPSSSGYETDYNLCWNGSKKASGGDTNSIAESFTADVTMVELSNGVTVEFDSNASPASISCPVITEAFIGAGSRTGLGVENPDGSSITIDTDITGAARGGSPKVGPLQSIANGANSFTLYAGADAP